MPVATSARSKRNRKGRKQRQRSHTARTRRPNLVRFYRRELPAIDPLGFSFRLDLLRGRSFPSIRIDKITESFDWADEESMLTGSITLRRPEAGEESLPVKRGHQVRCRIRWRGKWYELWRMRCEAPQTAIESDAVTVTVELRDDLNRVRRGKRKYLYRAQKRRKKHGWFGHEALRDAAKKDGIPLGKIARCTKRMKKISVHGSFLDLAKKVYENEREETGRRFVMRMRNGRFEVVEFRRNKLLYVLQRAILSAQIEEQHKVENPVTVISARARIGKGSDAKKVRYTHFRREYVARYGWVRKEKDYGRVESYAALKKKVHRDLADQYIVDETLNVSHPGLPFLYRGDGAKAVVPSDGFKDDDAFVWVRSIRHSVATGGDYKIDTQLVREDSFVKYERRREKERRDRARKERRRRRRKGET